MAQAVDGSTCEPACCPFQANQLPKAEATTAITAKLTPATDFSTADGDIVYMSFESPAAKDKAAALLDSPAWKKLAATRDNRVFVVNNEVWQTGQGIVAARGMLDDLHWLNAPIN